MDVLDDLADKPSKDANEADIRVGRRVRALRLERNLSLADLASRTGVSIGALSQIERGMSSLRVRVIWPLAAALEVEPSALIADGSEPLNDLYSVRAGSRRSLPVRSEGISKELLSPPGAALTGMLVIVEPGGGTAEAYAHSGHEFGFVSTGEVELVVDATKYLLKTGDSFAFKSTLLHSFRNPGAERCVIVWVNTANRRGSVMMRDALLRLQAVSKQFAGGTFGLKDVDLDIASGEFLSLLGPSGCGKTTSLRVIAGFESPTAGRVMLDGRDITPLRPYDRPVNTVFQDYALFPHMDVAENVGFGLSLRKMAGAEQAKRVAGALDMVGLADKVKSRVHELSGGQRQRVALARAIVCEPRVLLLDEPLSALDAHLREQMQVELKRLQSTLGTTFVMVTHDQTEAMSISDRIVVMNKAEIEQIASPAELYDRPATTFVASFIGTMNLFKARFEGQADGRLRFTSGGIALDLPPEDAGALVLGAACTIGVRPEDIVAAVSSGDAATPGTVRSIVFHGRSLRLHADIEGGQTVVVDIPRQSDSPAFHAGDTAFISLRRGATCSILPA